MRFAVLANAIRQGLDAPVLALRYLAAHLLEDGLVLVGQFVDLLRAEILARKEDVFVQRHGLSFLSSRSVVRRQASSSLGKARTPEMREHGTAGHRPCRDLRDSPF